MLVVGELGNRDVCGIVLSYLYFYSILACQGNPQGIAGRIFHYLVGADLQVVHLRLTGYAVLDRYGRAARFPACLV